MATTQYKDKEANKDIQQAQKRAEQAGQAASDAVSHAASAAVSTADKAAETAGGGLKSVAGGVRENTPNEGVLGAASSAVANTLEQTGEYLQKEGVSGAARDVHQLIKTYPVTSVMVGVAMGYLLACATTSRS